MGATLELVTTGGIQGDQASRVVDEVAKQFPGTRFNVVQIASDSEEARAVGVEGGVPVLLLDGFPVSRGIPTGDDVRDLLRQYVAEEQSEWQRGGRYAHLGGARQTDGLTAWVRGAAQAAGTVLPATLFGFALAMDIAGPRLNRRGRRTAQRLSVSAAAVGTACLAASIVARELEPRLRGRVVQPNEVRVAVPGLVTVGLQTAALAIRLTRGARRHPSATALGLSIAALGGLAAVAAAMRRQDFASMPEFYEQE